MLPMAEPRRIRHALQCHPASQRHKDYREETGADSRSKISRRPEQQALQYGERQPLVCTQMQKCSCVPEGRRKLAGGGAERSHRDWSKPILRPGRDAGPGLTARPILVRRPSRARLLLLRRFRWLCCARAPANFLWRLPRKDLLAEQRQAARKPVDFSTLMICIRRSVPLYAILTIKFRSLVRSKRFGFLINIVFGRQCKKFANFLEMAAHINASVSTDLVLFRSRLAERTLHHVVHIR